MGSFFRQPFPLREVFAGNRSIESEEQGVSPNPKSIAVAAASPGAGASFVCGLLADSLRSRGSVCLLEPGAPHFYEALGMEKRFALRGFVPYFEKLRAAEPVRSIENLDAGIRFALRLPDDSLPLTAAEAFRLLAIPKCDYNIFDCSRMTGELLAAFLAQADTAVLVLDPLPSRLLSAGAELQRLRLALPEAFLLVNRMNPGVPRAELARFLGVREPVCIPAVETRLVYRAEYDCTFCSQMPEGRRALKPTQDMLIKIFQ